MPVLAAALADVLVPDAHPLVLLGLEHHLLDQPAVLLLDPRAVGQRPAHVVEPLGEIVAERLQLAEGEHPRPASGRHAPVEASARVRGADQRGQVRLEPAALLEQVAPGRPLVWRREDKRWGRRWRLENAGHEAMIDTQAPVRRTSEAVQSASSTAISGTPFTCTVHRSIRVVSGSTPRSSAMSPKSTATDRSASETTICRTDRCLPSPPSRSFSCERRSPSGGSTRSASSASIGTPVSTVAITIASSSRFRLRNAPCFIRSSAACSAGVR